jgi:hypothetical protein
VIIETEEEKYMVELKQKLKLECQPKLKTVILETNGVAVEISPGDYGYLKCYSCESECESLLEWEDIFCLVCNKRKAGLCDKPKGDLVNASKRN